MSHIRDEYRGGAKEAFQVVDPFVVYELIGTVESNTYFGSSQALGHLYRARLLGCGEVIIDVPGGTYWVQEKRFADGTVDFSEKGRAVEVVARVDSKHPFEKVYLPPRSAWPLDRMNPLGWDDVGPYEYVRRPDGEVLTYDQVKELGAAIAGMGIHWVIPLPADAKPEESTPTEEITTP